MRRFFLAAVLATTFSLFAGAAEIIAPEIIPRPQECTISPTDYIPFTSIKICCEDQAAAEWADRHLKEWYGEFAPTVKPAALKAALDHEEYNLSVAKSGVTVRAGSLQAVRHALSSLRQIAIPSRGTATVSGWIVPISEIKDRPAMAFRGIHICWFHETEAWEVERQIRMAAYYKLNYAVIEPWGTFRSDIAPWYGWSDGTMTKEEISRLKAIADDLGITLIPQLNVFGHASLARDAAGKHAALDLAPEYQPLFEPMGGWNWCLSNPEARKLVLALISELSDAFGNPEYFHIGCDEANRPSCPDCIRLPYSELFLNHLSAINSFLIGKGVRPMMWHDMLLEEGDARWKGFYANGTGETAKAAENLPKDIVICDWFYGQAAPAYPTLDYFKSLGYQVLSCPWYDAGGIIAQGSYAAKSGIHGMLGTLWHHNFGYDMMKAYVNLANISWNAGAPAIQDSWPMRFKSHLRQVGWDMGTTDPRRTGLYQFEVPQESELNN